MSRALLMKHMENYGTTRPGLNLGPWRGMHVTKAIRTGLFGSGASVFALLAAHGTRAWLRDCTETRSAGRVRALVWLTVTLVLAGCEDYDCLSVATELRPSEATIAVGGAFIAHVVDVSCSGALLGEREARWSATDTTIVRVDSITGVVQGVALGVAEVRAASTSGLPFGEVAVEVVEP